MSWLLFKWEAGYEVQRTSFCNALKRQATDRVPYCELFVDVAMAEQLLNRSLGTQGTAGRAQEPVQHRAGLKVARFLVLTIHLCPAGARLYQGGG